MNYKIKILIIGIVLFALLNVSVASANENMTEISDTYSSIVKTNDNLNIDDSLQDTGNNELKLNLNDDEVYRDADNNSTEEINAHILILNNVNEYQNGNFTFKLVDNNDMPIEGEILNLKKFDEINREYNAVTDKNGVAKFRTADLYEYTLTPSFSEKPLDVGKHLVEVSAERYNAENILTNLTINKAKVKIQADNITVTYGDGKFLNITVTNVNNDEPVPEAMLHLYMENTASKDYYFHTSSKGQAKVNINGLVSGIYEFAISCNDTGNFESNTVNGRVIIKGLPVEITLTSKLNIKLNDMTTVTFKITDKNTGEPIPYAIVTAKIYTGSKSQKYSLKSNGKGIITINKPLTIGQHKIIVKTNDGRYADSSITKTITVTKSSTSISVEDDSCLIGKYSKLTATVEDKNRKPIKEGKVVFTINGKKYTVNVKNGVATKKIKLSKAKTYSYTAKFSSSNYATKTGKAKVVVLREWYTIKIGKYNCKIHYKDYNKIIKAKNNGQFSKKYYTGKNIDYKVYKDKKIVSTKKKLYSYGSYTTYYKNNPDAFNAPKGYEYAGKEHIEVNGIEKTYIIYKKTYYKKILASTKQTKVYIVIDSSPMWGATAKLYYKEYMHYDNDGGVETKYYLSNDKQIF